MFQKVVITGVAGFIGSHLAHFLANQGAGEIIGIDSGRSGDWSRVPENINRNTNDLSDLSLIDLSKILKNVDVLFHLAAEKYNSSKSSPERLLMSNVIATERLFRAASLSHVRRTVFTSSLYAYGSAGPKIMKESDVSLPNTLYGATKLMGEHILRSVDKEIEFSWNAARLFFVYGPNQFANGGYKSVVVSNFERLLRNDSPVIRGDGLQSLDYVYIDDCIDALVRLATSKNERHLVNVASGNPISINQLTSKMMRVAQVKKVPVIETSDWTHGSIRFGDSTKMLESFGWKASTTIDEGLDLVYGSMKIE